MPEHSSKKIKIPFTITVKKFSQLLGIPVSQVVKELMQNKILATINEEIDFETAAIIAQDLGFEVEEDFAETEGKILTLEKLTEICREEKNTRENLQERPPVVTILGHVDHGKTTLLDTLRKTNIAAREAGGITQHIQAYQVKKRGKLITFIDTPGHAAFSAMRKRGASLADIVVLVVASDDGVQPQTKEVIEYIKERKVPTIVAINKIDKPEANIARIKKELTDNGLLLEDWGGDIMSAEISAKKNIGLDDLLEKILLLAELENFRSDSKRDGLAIVLESRLDPQKGPIAVALIKTGTLRVGQDIMAGSSMGRIRKMEDFSGRNLISAGPSTPVVILGLNSTPQTNDVIQVLIGRTLERAKIRKISDQIGKKPLSLKTESDQSVENKEKKKLLLVVKADVKGSLEAIIQILDSLKSEEVAIECIHSGIGVITESDVKLAASTGAIVLGFNVEITSVARRIAEAEKVSISLHKVIYQLLKEIKQKMSELLPSEIIRTNLGKIKVLAIFKTSKRDVIIGGRVTEGKAVRKSKIEVKRGEEVVGQGLLANLQQNKLDVQEVGQGNECGLVLEGYTKIKAGDDLIIYTEEEKRKEL